MDEQSDKKFQTLNQDLHMRRQSTQTEQPAKNRVMGEQCEPPHKVLRHN